MFLRYCTLINLSFLLFTINVFPQKTILSEYDQPLQFERISLESGLSQSTVNAIIQDKHGFMWFGTEDGLNRYDGYSFKVYKHIPGNESSLCNNFITALCLDNEDNIWLGTDGSGACKFDPISEKFKHYVHNPEDSTSIKNNIIISLLCDHNGNIWFGTWGSGVSVLDYESGSLLSINPRNSDNDILDLGKIWTVYEDSRGYIWLGTDGLGVARMLADSIFSSPGIEIFISEPDDKNSISDNSVLTVFEDSGGVLWLGTYYNGLNQFDYQTGNFTRFLYNPDIKGSISENAIWKVLEDSRGTLWIGSMSQGLNIYDRENNKFKKIQNVPNNSSSLSSNNIRSMYEDKSGVLWIGAMTGSLNKLNTAVRKFAHIKNEAGRQNTLSNDFVFSICEDRRGDIWIGTYGDGLNRYNPAQDKFTIYKNDPNDPSSLSSDVVRCTLEDSKGTLWIGTYFGGLSRYDFKSDSFERFQMLGATASSENIRDIFEDIDGNLWLGTNGAGLFKLNQKNKHFQHYDSGDLDSEYVLKIAQDSSGVFWIGTYGGGLNKFKPSDGTFTQYKHTLGDTTSLSHDIIPEIFIDSKKRIWVGTFGGGLDLFEPKSGRFTNYRESDGLGGNIICGIIEDEKGLLWLGTNKGLTRFDPETKKFRKYDVSDGLQKGEMNPGASFHGKSGILYFGGVNGFNCFLPERVRENPVDPATAITSFKIFEQPVLFERSITFMDELKLSYADRFFSFEFAALDYTNPAKNRYRYKMDGFDDGWIESGSRRYASYTNLDPDSYVFQVQGSNNDGLWSSNVASIQIEIVPPFWLTWWFKVILTVSLITLALFFYNKRVSSLKKEKEIQEEFSKQLIDTQEKERKRIASELHDSIGQELLILNNEIKRFEKNKEPVKDTELDSLSIMVMESLNGIREISSSLHPHLVERLGLKKAIESMVKKVKEVAGIDFQLNIQDLKQALGKEEEIHVYRIVQEALTNVVKYAQATTVNIDLLDRKNNYELVISDNGKGFRKKSSNLGFGLQSLSERSKILNGKLLVKSTPGSGTKITMKVPYAAA